MHVGMNLKFEHLKSIIYHYDLITSVLLGHFKSVYCFMCLHSECCSVPVETQIPCQHFVQICNHDQSS